MDITFKFNPPIMPDNITYDTGIPGRKQDGYNPGSNSIPVKNLSQEQAEQYAELMKQTFLEHWKTRVSEDD